PAKILFIIIVHGRDFRQFKRLLTAIYNKNHYYYIHTDKRSEYLCNKIRDFIDTRKERNIAVTSWNLEPMWGSSSFLDVLLRCMKDVLLLERFSEWKWDFYVNLSGSDYPIKKIDQFTAYLSLRKGKNFISSMSISTAEFVKRQGLNFLFYECDNRMWRIGKRSIPSHLHFYGGSDWIILSYQFCSYLVTSSDPFINDIILFYKYALLPAESFFHVVLRNSEFCGTIVYDNLRLINWKTNLSCHCQYRKIVDWCGCSPSNYRRSDISRIDTSKAVFFARKFEPLVNQEILNMIDELLLGKKLRQPNRYHYWQNLCHASEFIAGKCSRYKFYIESCMRLARSNMTSLLKKKIDRSLEFAELVLINQNDTFAGMLVSFLISTNLILEVWMKKRQLAWAMPLSKGAERLYDMQVGSNLDKKEQIFRNYGILSANDELTVFQRWRLGPKFHCNLTWVKPDGEIADHRFLAIESNWRFSYFKAEILKPVIPGRWKVYLSINNIIFSELQFILFPVDSRLIRGLQTSSALGNDYLAELPRLGEANSNVMYTSNRLNYDNIYSNKKWIDSLVSESWETYKFCVGVKDRDVNNASLKLIAGTGITNCEDSEWSSFIKDHKTEFRSNVVAID
ncbi:uncharacterized protein TRIADDRAFT_21022, partial [Trichoplax adhaerens]